MKSKLFRYTKISLILLPIILVFGYVWGILNGTPWGKYYAKKEALTYMENNYGINETELKAIDVEYSFKLSTNKCNHYDINLLSKVTNTKFRVNKSYCKFSDNYINNILGNEVEPQLKEFIDNVYSNKETIIAHVDFKDDNLITKIPSFVEIQSKANVGIEIDLDIGINSNNEDLEIEKMMKTIEFLKNKGYYTLKVTFLFKGVDSKVKYLTLNESDLIKIQIADNLKTIIKQKYDKF